MVWFIFLDFCNMIRQSSAKILENIFENNSDFLCSSLHFVINLLISMVLSRKKNMKNIIFIIIIKKKKKKKKYIYIYI